MSNKRILFVDYAKAVCIFLVIVNHVGVDWVKFIGSILMTLFFFSSGFTAHFERYSIAQNAIKLIKKVMIPFWIAMFLYGIAEIFRAQYLGYGDANIFLPAMVGLVYGSFQKVPLIPGISDTVKNIMSYKPAGSDFLNIMLPLNCHLWFLPAFFTGAMVFIIYLKVIGKKRTLVTDVIAVILLLVLSSIEGFPGIVQYPLSLGRGFFCCACMIAGRICREREVFQYLDSNKWRLLIGGLLLLAIAIATSFAGAAKASLTRSDYGTYVIFSIFNLYICGISATIFIMLIMKKISDKYKSKFICYVGQHTLTIYLWHMLFLNVISILVLEVTGIEVARDIWFMAIIPRNYIGLLALVSVLTLLCCLGVALLNDKLNNRKRLHNLHSKHNKIAAHSK